ncbi:uncharacterized protein J7T54_001169 [Emericellopsis cladophorae]|uniref:Altered inheritance of mitochondria protein 24, mitochondrial n=1 Tax=Emericellopsis cladophorae TaxID=2686198 RepID=A0A9Q0BDK9_9HYPO|nr:uncharacterized protein J7T54_001169 [Emericellopsis cladophorae]KAI6780665.1 hypothetical protein J7T54_001169 [Emericellopsis cladophorae]
MSYQPPPHPPPQQQQQSQQQHHPQQQQHYPPQSDSGTFPGGQYTVSHRDTNAVLNLDLQQGATIKGKPGVMIHMAGSIQLTGKTKFSMKKLMTGGEMSESTYVGPGRLALGPTLFGDIITLHVDGRQNWIIGKDAFLACTPEVHKESKSQGFSKALFSGEDLFVYHVQGQGIIWLTSFGAVDRLDLRPGEHHIVDNGHLVAWSCDYKIEKAGGGFMGSMKTGEGLVCRFTGPGSVYVQTRNMDEFKTFIAACVGPQ